MAIASGLSSILPPELLCAVLQGWQQRLVLGPFLTSVQPSLGTAALLSSASSKEGSTHS